MRDRVILPRRALRRSPRHELKSRQRYSLFDAPKEALGGISEIVVLGQPAALNTVKAVNSFDRPVAAGFPCLCGIQRGELTLCRKVQGTPPVPAACMFAECHGRMILWEQCKNSGCADVLQHCV